MLAALKNVDTTVDDLSYELVDVMAALEKMKPDERPIEEIFRFMERHDKADLGGPGPIVHALEAVGGYERELLASVRRKPGTYSLMMVHRLLGSRPPSAMHQQWLAELERVAADKKCSAGARREAKEYLALQANRK